MKYQLTDHELKKFKNWILNSGGQVLEPTNAYEAIRFKGDKTGVLYKSGKVANAYTRTSIQEWKSGKNWSGRPIATGRYNSYKKQKRELLKRDGRNCMLCGLPLGEDITVEYILDLSKGGRNDLGNMVLMHRDCNESLNGMTLASKMKRVIQVRSLVDYDESNSTKEQTQVGC